MYIFSNKLSRIVISALLIALPAVSEAAEKRPMTVEDVMNFHHLHSPVINHNGKWIAYYAKPDRGDGYGVLVSSDGKTEHKFERGQQPRFSVNGDWLLLTRIPPFSETEGVKPEDQPKDSLLLIQTRNGSSEGFAQLRRALFSQTQQFLFVHQHNPKDTTLTKSQNEKLQKTGSPLIIRNLGNGNQLTLSNVDSWTVDSLATTIVYTVKDTTETGNGLYFLNLKDLSSAPQVIDTIGKMKFDQFTWHQASSQLAYLRALDMEKDTMETATLHIWKPSSVKPDEILTNGDAPKEHFIPFNNRLSWNKEGNRLFFGLRPDRFAATPEGNNDYLSDTDSIRQQAEIDIWHVNDPLIKTHEKVAWKQVSRQNLMAVYHFDKQIMVPLATEAIPDVQLAASGDYALASTVIPHAKKMTWDGRFRNIYVINILTGEKQLVLEDFGHMSLISPNGRFLLYFQSPHWYSYEIETALHRNLTQPLDVPFYDETHDRPSQPSSYRLAGWMEDGQSPLIYDRYDVWLANLGSGKMTSITGGQGRKTQTVLRINRLDVEPFFKTKHEIFLEGFNENTMVRSIYTARLDKQGINKIMDTGRNLRLREISGDGKSILYTDESFDVFPDLWVTSKSFQNPAKITDLNRQLSDFNWGTSDLISFQSADGIPLKAVVIKPGNYDPSKKYPVFVYYYEKSSHRLHEFNQTVINHRPGFGFYSSNDYVILLPDIHFIEGRPGMSAVKSLVPAVQKLIDTGIADPNAIGLHGHSWSGYQTAYVVTQTDIFTAAIAGAPVSNMTSAYGGIRWGSGMARQFMYEKGQSRLGASLFENRDLYIENSPLFYANEINTPLLLMHGDEDEAVPWEQSIELYLAMRRAGKDVIFLQYRDEPHHPQKYANKLDYTIRMKEYFDYHLKGFDAPDWIKNGKPYMGK